jgi:hypothetical protein
MFWSEITHVLPSRRIVRVGGLDEPITTPEHYQLRWSYNGRRDATDYYGASCHKTLRGARIAMANRRRASLAWK